MDDPEVDALVESNTLETLKQLVGMLSHSRIRVRHEAAKAASGLAAWGPEGQEALLTSNPDPLPILVAMIADSHQGCATWALSALANLCKEGSSERMVKEGAIESAINRITAGIQGQPEDMLENASKLLANLTRQHEGRQAALGYLSDGSYDKKSKQIIRMCELFVESRSHARDPLCSLALFFENIAQESSGAKLLCNDEDGFLLGAIAKDLARSNEERMLGAAGTIKNCCFQKDQHRFIAENKEITALLCVQLVGDREGFDDDDRNGMYPGLASKCLIGGKYGPISYNSAQSAGTCRLIPKQCRLYDRLHFHILYTCTE